ncbi:MAG: hypothetical protein AB1896_00900 [Thermodesulfobacteriota bacterium]
MTEKVIPLGMVPESDSEVIELGGRRYLQSNEAMFTFYKRTKGELSPYFLALKERKVILGAKCPRCGLVRVPPFMLFCPDCDFAALETIEMTDTGVMNSTPPITYFGHALFQHQVPFGRGRVLLDGADTALPILVYTTKGVLTPRIFKKGTPVKVIFRDTRLGKPTDIFAVPLAEVPADKRDARGLQESELDWESPAEPELPAPTAAGRKSFEALLPRLEDLAAKVAASDRARKDLAGWRRNILVKTPGGDFSWIIAAGRLAVQAGAPAKPDLVMVARDEGVFGDWMNFQESLTNAIISERLWISLNREFITVFKLDRLPRSIRRTGI